ncbi:MAG TPA: hypothetical protein VNZ27_09760 [Rhodanobacter sp.]|nr:hypothetical protein [Rhodanobacter sp.]
MKKILTFAVMMIFSSIVFAQSSTHPKATYKNSSNAQISITNNPSNAANGTPKKIGNPIHGAGQQGSAGINQQAGSPPTLDSSNGNRKICRIIGSTVYYCL